MKENTRRTNTVIRKILFSAQLACTMTVLAPQMIALINGIIVSQYLGVNAFKAISTFIPIMGVSFLLVNIFCLGPSIQAGQAYGELNKRKANSLFTVSALMSSLVTVIIVGCLFAFGNGIVDKMTTNEVVEAYFRAYYKPALLSLLFNVPVCLLSTYVTAAGCASKVTVATVISGIANLVAIFVFVPILHLGIAAPAYASVIASVVNAAILLPLVLSDKFPFGLLRPNRELLSLIKNNCWVWVSINSGILSTNILQFVGNILVLHFLSSDGMFVWGICLAAMNVANSLIAGVDDAYLYIDSSFVGEGDTNGRIKMAKVFLVELGVVTFVTAFLLSVFHSQIAVLFGAETQGQIDSLKIPLRCVSWFCASYYFFLSFGLFSINSRPGIKLGYDVILCFVCPLVILLTTVVFGAKMYWYSFLFMIPIIALYPIVVSAIIYRKNRNLIPYFLFERWPDHVMLDVSVDYTVEDVEKTERRIKVFLSVCEISDLLAMRIALCCRELMDNILTQNHRADSFDLRLVEGNGEITLVVKSVGRPSSPLISQKDILDYWNNDEIPDEGELQLLLVNNSCTSIDYHYIYGMNETYVKFRE